MSAPHVVVLGGGPAGVGAAFRLGQRGQHEVTLVERHDVVGGNAGSFEHRGLRVDYGSHRLHAATAPEILADVRRLLGEDLRTRPRRGRIRLAGRWVRFPLSAPDLLLRLDRGFAVGVVGDLLRRTARRGAADESSFATLLRAQLGATICERFYFPYARKIWGLEPEELAAGQARKRVSANSFGRLAAKLLRRGGDTFFYPRRGFGQISEAYAAAAVAHGAALLTGYHVERLERRGDGGAPWVVEARRGDERRRLHAQHLFATLPLTALARMIDPPPPAAAAAAASALAYRAMVLVYVELDVDRFSATDAHYFPEPAIRATRISEPKNYSGADEPRGRTVLCAEIPCTAGDALWSADDAALGELVIEDLRRADLPLARPPVAVFTRRLSHAYPIFRVGYEAALEGLEAWLETLPGLTSFGRQGAFAHDNTHHALAMAYGAVDCLGGDGFDGDGWARRRREFAAHVVED